MMEIIFHKCEFVGEMAVVQQAQRSLSLESYDRIEQTLNQCIQAKLLPANLLTRRAAILMRSYISGLMENWLFAPQSFDLKKKRALRRDFTGNVSALPDAAQRNNFANGLSHSRIYLRGYVRAILRRA
jgi:TetR/AcrR family acrAB operon transcriptional repressor